MFLDHPQGFADPVLVQERRGMVESVASFRPLRQLALDIAERRRKHLSTNVAPGIGRVPDFDPAEASVDARVLFVMEAPGPKTLDAPGWGGSGFISADNNDPTARNLWLARRDAGILDAALHWNIAPWVLGPAKVKPTEADLEQGGAELLRLLALLPQLRVVVPLGEHAQQGWLYHVSPFTAEPIRVVPAPHPSAMSMARTGARGKLARMLSLAARYAG